MNDEPDSKRHRIMPETLPGRLADEGFRLFFPLSAAYAALFPVFWVLAMKLGLPLAHTVPSSLWHAHEMLVGAFGAALIGFLTTAIPEWTDTEPLRGRPLWLLAALWGGGRVIGLLGWDGMSAVGALADLVWIAALILYVIRLSVRQRSDNLLSFAFWLLLLWGCVAVARISFLTGDIARASTAIQLSGFAFLGLLGLALARITVPVTNLVLDPSETTSPFRPHPGRLNLAAGLVLVAIFGQAAGLSPAVAGFLVFAAGAAFMDRVAEAFIGVKAFRAEILILAGSSGLAGVGLMMVGAAKLGAPWPEVTGLHVTFMGGLGLGVYAVFCIAGLLHTNPSLGLSLPVRLGALMLLLSVILRIMPDIGIALPGSVYAYSSLAWALGFLIWLCAYWPYLASVASPPAEAASGDAMMPLSSDERECEIAAAE
ncbi:NnrS family protein [Paracoccus sp. SCSIO 75233]|uniref:NnrS family protein n=1 Tax=Paracoccus sp. SCSIO 75233 TaxID=3017782 RepID=UPI0022F0E574|nr:NnrS family protein [Paracoccus sp. SCSIO 75233]WBU53993.1 NnrS family protein [Paracoccus sp. SCSIO 75233]